MLGYTNIAKFSEYLYSSRMGKRLHPTTMTAINVTSSDYTDSEGFLIYIPSTFTGNIVATPLNGSEITFSDYTVGAYLRNGVLFSEVSTDTVTKTGLEAWK